MAKFVQIYENNIEKSILIFRGQEFTCTMVMNEDGSGATSLEKCLEIQIEEAFPNDEDIECICELVEEIEYDDADKLYFLEQLEDFE
jgi:DNA-directed RNA polymerase specialized sigma54-like protein